MGQFIKNPVAIEAVRITAADFNGSEFDGSPFSEVPEWIQVAMSQGTLVPIGQDTDYAVWDVRTNHGVVRAEPGDWILRQVDGEIYPCRESVFAATYGPAPTFGADMHFGEALDALKAGERVCRAGWNGKGMWLALTQGTPDLPAEKFWNPHNRAFAEQNGGAATVLPSITMKTATGEILMGWLASQTDMLAEDWMVLPADAACPPLPQ